MPAVKVLVAQGQYLQITELTTSQQGHKICCDKAVFKVHKMPQAPPTYPLYIYIYNSPCRYQEFEAIRYDLGVNGFLFHSHSPFFITIVTTCNLKLKSLLRIYRPIPSDRAETLM